MSKILDFGDAFTMGNVTFIWGKLPICPLCKEPILNGEEAIIIKALSEYKRGYHFRCIKKFANEISNAWIDYPK